MHAVVAKQAGGPEVLEYEEVERPQPGEGEVLLRVHAAAVNPYDWKSRRSPDTDFPAILGGDVSGVVERPAGDWAEGDEVFGFANAGYAEYATASAELIARKPPEIDHVHAAGIPVAGLTAWQALFDVGGLEAGQTVVIAGAAGGVGHFAVQFAKLRGARVVGTGSGSSRDFVLGLGADEFVDYREQEVGEAVHDADLAFDTVGGETTATLVPALRDGGLVVTIAGAPPEDPRVRSQLLVMKPNGAQLQEIAELVAAGKVRVEIAEALPLAEAARAHEASESGRTRGKLILVASSRNP
jgi:NADPH:quinone reductase-like Zn-dependent oxidoreductase